MQAAGGRQREWLAIRRVISWRGGEMRSLWAAAATGVLWAAGQRGSSGAERDCGCSGERVVMDGDEWWRLKLGE